MPCPNCGEDGVNWDDWSGECDNCGYGMDTDDEPDWSTPDPADTGDVDLDDIKDEMPDEPPEAETTEMDEMVMVRDATCDECTHVEVCALVSGMRPMLESWQAGEGPESDAPIDVLDLAKICPEFIPADEVAHLRQGSID